MSYNLLQGWKKFLGARAKKTQGISINIVT